MIQNIIPCFIHPPPSLWVSSQLFPWCLPGRPNRIDSHTCSCSFGTAPWTCFGGRHSQVSPRIWIKSTLLQISCVSQVLCELIRVVLAQYLNRSSQLLLFDLFVFLLLVGCFQTLPWEHSSEEVHGHIANWLQVVSSAWIIHQLHCSIPRWVLMEA